MSNNHCEHEGCDTTDCLIGVGCPPKYYCCDHFDDALKKEVAPFKNAVKTIMEPSKGPTEEELLEEAKAWGFDSVDEWLKAMTKAHDEANADG